MAREITDILRDLNGGAFVKECTDAMAEAVATSISTGKKSELTIRITLKPARGSKEQITVSHDLKLKTPDFDRPDDHMFVVGGDTVSTKHPRQTEMPLQAVNTERGPIQKVSAA